MNNKKESVRLFWNNSSCGENLYLIGESEIEKFNNEFQTRYELEPEILDLVNFSAVNGKKVLEIGVGLGADHQNFATNGADLYGIDLTDRAIFYTKKRFELYGLKSNLQVSDAENLPFKNDFFDIVYSWGVIHHSPDTQKAIDEIFRTLKKGGEAKIMIYNTRSFVGYMLWIRYAFLKMKFNLSLKEIYDKYLESPGTKAYTKQEAKAMFSAFSSVSVSSKLSHADLLNSDAGQRHRGWILTLAKVFYPRFIIKKLFPSYGLFLIIKAIK